MDNKIFSIYIAITFANLLYDNTKKASLVKLEAFSCI
jgi:hypothetical protein